MSPVWRVRALIFLLALLAGAMGYAYFTQRISPEERAAQEAAQIVETSPTPTPGPDTKIVNFAQMLAVPYDLDEASSASTEAMLDFISINKPGMVVLFGTRISTSSATTAVTTIFNETVTEDRPLLAVDHEGGSVQRLNGEGFTSLPTWKRVCGQTSEVRQEFLATSAAELHTLGVSVVFAPVLDVSESNNILRDRACSGDPEIVTEASLDFISAFQKEKILPVLKHYPGLGTATIDTHKNLGSVLISEIDIAPYKNILDRYPRIGVMTAHIAVENQASEIPCSLSASCVSQLFQLYPDVVVFSDALEMQAALYNPRKPESPKSLESVAIEAIKAGNTVLVFGQDVTAVDLDRVIARMKLEYTNSSDFRNKVNTAVAKISQLQSEYSQVSESEND